MAKIEPANLLLKDKNGNTGLVKSLTNKDITTLKNVVTNVNYIKDFVNANGGSLPIQGDLKLTATDAAGKNGKILLGTSSGTLQWNGKNIVRSINGTNADAGGNITLPLNYLPLSGGTLTGGHINRNVDNEYISLIAGKSYNTGATVEIFGKDYPNDGLNDGLTGGISLVTVDSNGDNKYRLNLYSNGSLQWGGREVNPIGEVCFFACSSAPKGYLVCNGATVSRTTYANLFAVIGTTFGSGDGSTTFALPNLIDRFAQGSTTVGTNKSAGLPNITGGHREHAVSEATRRISTNWGAL